MHWAGMGLGFTTGPVQRQMMVDPAYPLGDLRRYLNWAQRQDLEDTGRFNFRGSDGTLYRVHAVRGDYNVWSAAYVYCAGPSRGYVSGYEKALAQMLYIRQSEAAWSRVANRTPRSSASMRYDERKPSDYRGMI